MHRRRGPAGPWRAGARHALARRAAAVMRGTERPRRECPAAHRAGDTDAARGPAGFSSTTTTPSWRPATSAHSAATTTSFGPRCDHSRPPRSSRRPSCDPS